MLTTASRSRLNIVRGKR